MADTQEKPLIGTMDGLSKSGNPQDYYEAIKQKFAQERDLRLDYRPEGTAQYTSDLSGALTRYEVDPYGGEVTPREPINDTVECLFIGGGFSALLTSARLREYGVESIRIVERGADVGGTWYWNRYPGVACDVVSYDYLPLLDEMDYVPKDHYAKGPEILAHCQAIAKKYNLYELAVFQTTVTSTVWDEDEELWHLTTDRGDHMKARFVICANGTLSKPKLSKIKGMETFQGHSFHTSRWDYDYTKDDLSSLEDKVVGIIGTGATAVQAIPGLGASAKELYVFQRTPSSIDIRDDWPTDPNWARRLKPGWQTKRRHRAMRGPQLTPEQRAERAAMSREEKIRRQENANIDYMMRIHKRIDEIVKDKATAEALKPWYMFMCKRPCFHNDYLPTFNRPNVQLVDTKGKGVERVTENAVVVDGVEYEVDCIIYATGFEVGTAYTRRAEFEVYGRDGLSLTDYWSDGMKTYHGLLSNGFPNCFHMGLTQTGLAPNFTYMLNGQATHIAHIVAEVGAREMKSVEPTREAEAEWVELLTRPTPMTEYQDTCTPGYYNGEGKNEGAGFIAIQYPEGAVPFYNMLASWREQGDFEGLSVK
jgi:cyclohexanone monooxygenase